jgi:hypothetical protein
MEVAMSIPKILVLLAIALLGSTIMSVIGALPPDASFYDLSRLSAASGLINMVVLFVLLAVAQANINHSNRSRSTAEPT